MLNVSSTCNAVDAENLKEEPSLESLEGAVTDIDEALRGSVQQVLTDEDSHEFNRNLVTDNTAVQYGDKHAK